MPERIYQSLYPSVPDLPPTNIHHVFNPPSSASADHLLYIDGLTGQKRMKQEFWARVRDAATALSVPRKEGGPGIGSGQIQRGEGESGHEEVVGILSHNCLEYPVLMHALLLLGIPFALLSAFSTPFELAHALRTSCATALFVHPSLLDTALGAAQEVGLDDGRVWALGDKGTGNGRMALGDMVEEAREGRWSTRKRAEVRQVGKYWLAYLVFSSGTSGLPKAVMISHGNIHNILAASTISSLHDVGPPDPTAPPPVILAFLPFYHTYGLHYLCLRGFTAPQTFVIVPRWDLELVLGLIPKYRINALPLIPSAIHQIAHHKDLEKYDFRSVRSVSSGAAYLPPSLSQRMAKLFPEAPGVNEGYGMSETTVSAIHQPSALTFGGRVKRVIGSCGLLNPGMEARIVRPDGTDADVDEPGELWLRGGNIALGYWKNEKATKETFVEGGWLRTGDTFRVDRTQTFFFVDRAKDTLKVSGLQVSPTEIEDALLAHPEKLVHDACVAGVSGGRTSDEKVPRAWIVLNEAGRQQEERIVLAKLDVWIRKSLSKYKWLRGGIEVVDEIPKSPTGKVLRRVLQSEFEARKAKPAAKL